MRDVCARDVEEGHETGALAANSGRFVAHNEVRSVYPSIFSGSTSL